MNCQLNGKKTVQRGHGRRRLCFNINLRRKEIKTLQESKRLCVSKKFLYLSLACLIFSLKFAVTSRQKRFSNFRGYISAYQINTLVFP